MTIGDNEQDPLARYGLDAIDLRWTMKDIAAKRTSMINQQHAAKLIELGLVEHSLGISDSCLAPRVTGPADATSVAAYLDRLFTPPRFLSSQAGQTERREKPFSVRGRWHP